LSFDDKCLTCKRTTSLLSIQQQRDWTDNDDVCPVVMSRHISEASLCAVGLKKGLTRCYGTIVICRYSVGSVSMLLSTRRRASGNHRCRRRCVVLIVSSLLEPDLTRTRREQDIQLALRKSLTQKNRAKVGQMSRYNVCTLQITKRKFDAVSTLNQIKS